MPARPRAPNSGAGVTVLESSISSIEDGVLRYRGYRIEQLAGAVPFEEVAWLLWTGEPAGDEARTGLTGGLRAGAALVPALSAALRHLPGEPGAVARLLMALPLLPQLEPALLRTNAEGFTGRASLLLGAFTLLAATGGGQLPAGLTAEAAAALLANGVAHAFLSLARGSAPTPEQTAALDTVLTLYADHELNASTFAGRVAASTRADLVSCIVAALCTLSGPLHGGVDRFVRSMLAATAEEGVEAVLDRYQRAGEHLPGFGHSVYRNGDPRAAIMRHLAQRLAPLAGEQRLFELTQALEQEAARRGLPPANIDLYTVAVYRSLGIPDRLSPLVFAAGRLPGWCAHIQEQYQRNRLIRPRAAYVGSPPREWPGGGHPEAR